MPRTRILLSAVVGVCLMSMLSLAQDDRAPEEAPKAKNIESLDASPKKPIKHQDNGIDEAPRQKKLQKIRENGASEPEQFHEQPHGEQAMQRLHHLHVAIQNLNAAGMHDLAKQAAQRAEAMEHEIRELHEHRAHKEQGRHVEGLEDLRREVHQLREELQELRRMLKQETPKPKKPNP